MPTPRPKSSEYDMTNCSSVVAEEASKTPAPIMAPPRSAVSRGPRKPSRMGPRGIPIICETMMKARTSDASGGPLPPEGDQYLRCAGR